MWAVRTSQVTVGASPRFSIRMLTYFDQLLAEVHTIITIPPLFSVANAQSSAVSSRVPRRSCISGMKF
jgi:hypothetical protein